MSKWSSVSEIRFWFKALVSIVLKKPASICENLHFHVCHFAIHHFLLRFSCKDNFSNLVVSIHTCCWPGGRGLYCLNIKEKKISGFFGLLEVIQFESWVKNQLEFCQSNLCILFGCVIILKHQRSNSIAGFIYYTNSLLLKYLTTKLTVVYI